MAPKKRAAPERVAFLAQIAQIAPGAELGRLYGMAMGSVARKTVVRLDQQTKTRFCKRCFVPRGPNTTTWRIEDLSRKKNRRTMVITCRCGHTIHRPLYEKTKKCRESDNSSQKASVSKNI